MNKIPFSAGDKIFIYLRDSGGEEQEISTDQQESVIRKWALENSLIITKVHKDEAKKGSSAIGRKALQELMYAFRHGCEERGVAVWRYNRFARSVDNAQFYRAEIRTRGYIFFSLNDHVPEGPIGRLMEAAIDFKDEQFLTDLSEDVKRGLYNLVEKYGCVPGPAPTGFKLEPVQIGIHRDGTPHIAHRRIPDPEIAPRVLLAFQLRSQRISLGRIHKETKVMGAINSYRTFFSNPIYKGTLLFGDRTYENFCEPMVPEELWEAVQVVQGGFLHHRQLRSSGIDHPRRTNSRFLLSGIAHCGRCESPLYGKSHKQKSGKYYDNYNCTRAYRRRDCTKQNIPRELFENAVADELTERILTPDILTATYEELQAGQSARLKEQDAKRKAIKHDLGIVRRKIRNISETIEENRTKQSKTLMKRLLELENEEADLLLKLDMLEATAEQPVAKIPREKMLLAAQNFKKQYEQSDMETKRTLLRSLIDHVDVLREGNMIRGIIYWFYPPGSTPPTVPTDHNPLGPPRYRHIAPWRFARPIKKSS